MHTYTYIHTHTYIYNIFILVYIYRIEVTEKWAAGAVAIGRGPRHWKPMRSN